jgi:sugar lactone lactonase YvrE
MVLSPRWQAPARPDLAATTDLQPPLDSTTFFGLALDASGNLFLADTFNYRIRRITPAGVISTVAGNGNYGFDGDGGLATAASLASPYGVAVDSTGQLLIADSDNYRIRKVTTAGQISTVAGIGSRGFSGDGGAASAALFNFPGGMAVDSSGNLLIADTDNSRIRKLTPAGIVSTIAGNGGIGFAGDGGLATAAVLNLPGSVAVGPDGTVYISDCSNRIRKVAPNGVISTHATSSWLFCSFFYYTYEQLSRGPLAVDASGNIFVADTFHYRIDKVAPDGTVSPYAGSGSSSYGFSGDGGPALSAKITEPWGIALDAAGNLYIADTWNNRIRKVTPGGIISTIAGTANAGFSGDGGPAISAQLNMPTALAVDAQNNLFVADTNNNRIRKIDLVTGIITTIAGNGTAGVSGDGGPPTQAQLDAPTNIALNANGDLFISDSTNSRIRKVTSNLTVPTITKVTPAFGAQGATGSFMLEGTSFTRPLTINAGAGISATNVVVLSRDSGHRHNRGRFECRNGRAEP